jgi:hypothetical protein
LSSPVIVHDRRRDLALRAVFDEVYPRVEGFFDPSRTWGGPPLMHWVYRIVRESHPQLDATQVQTLGAALHRVYRARHAHGGAAQAVTPADADALQSATR